MPAASKAGVMRLEIVTAKPRVQFRPKFRISRRPRLPDRTKPCPRPPQSARSRPKYRPDFPRFYGRGIGPGASFGLPRRSLGGSQDRSAVLVGHGGRKPAPRPAPAAYPAPALSEPIEKHEGAADGRNGPGVSSRRAGVTSRPATIADSARCAAGLFGRDRLDAGEADLAAVLQAKACAHRSRRRRGPRPAVRTRIRLQRPDRRRHQASRPHVSTYRDKFAATPCQF